MTKSNNKHIPQRTCVACRQINRKEVFIRLVKTASGSIEIDLPAKNPGRGAYLCAKKSCWDLAIKTNRIEYALRTKLSDSDRSMIIEYSNNLPMES